MNCNGAGGADDEIEKLEITYRNNAVTPQKAVIVDFEPALGKVTCRNNFNAVEKHLNMIGPNEQQYYCGDEDINVIITRKIIEGRKILKCQRSKCASASAAMFKQKGVYKFVMRTVVNSGMTYEGVMVGPVLAETKSGLCGKIVHSVTYDGDDDD